MKRNFKDGESLVIGLVNMIVLVQVVGWVLS
jgi:hypothetical protein